MPVIDGIEINADDLPHTVTSAILYRLKIDSFNELPKDKRPPRDLWNKPYKLEKFLDTIWEKDKKDDDGFVEYDEEDLE